LIYPRKENQLAVENSVLSQVQSLVGQLSPKEQQEVIQTIVSMKPANEAALLTETFQAYAEARSRQTRGQSIVR